MNLAVIAANGRTGQAFVEAALKAGHTVRAGSRTKSQLTPHPRLTILPGEATSSADMLALLSGQDAVACFIGHVSGSPPDVQTMAMHNIVQVMKNIGMKRVVSLTGTGVRFPGDTITLLDRLLNLSIRVIDPKRVEDGKQHVTVLQATDLEWTVIRVLKLQNLPAHPFRLLEHGPTKAYVGRSEVAQAVLQVLEQHSFIQKAPMIGRQQ
jgi:nucleoside-diphosphate-sugar epimerase